MTPSTVSPSPAANRGLGRDLIAGLVVFLVALPLCLGIAHASGAPLISGLISGIIGGLVVGALSGSHVSVSGPAAGLAAIVMTQIASLGSLPAFFLAVTLAGGLQILFGVLKGGVLANFFPTNVIKGLLAAIGVLLVLKQVPHLIGYDADYEGDMSFEQEDGKNTFTAITTALKAFLPGAVLVGFISLLILIAWESTGLKKLLFPGPLAAVLAGTLVSEILRLAGAAWSIESTHLVSVPVIGQGMGWGDLLKLPDFNLIAKPSIWMASLTLAIVASLETLLNLEATEKLDPERRPSPPNRELLAQGVGNMLAGLLGGLPMTSVIVRSSVNVNAGGRTRVSAIFHGILLLGSVLLLPGVLNRIPMSCLAAVLVVTGWKLANPRLFRSMWNEGIQQFLPFFATVVAIVLTDLLSGVLIGLAVSIAFILKSNLLRGFRIFEETHVGGMVHRIEFSNQATFLNRAQLAATFSRFSKGDHVLIDGRLSDYVDADIISMIREFTQETAPARGITVSLLGFKERYPLEDLIQYIDVSTREVQSSLTPARVLALLKDGNERFVSGKRLHRDLIRQVDATATGQHPMAAVLSCIDSRAPAELLFDLGIGDIFSVRVAGNVARGKALGSLEFACRVVGSKLIVVLGHTRCGAVKATCDFVDKGVDPVVATGLTNLPYITEPISEAVQAENVTRDNRSGSNLEFVDRVTAIHVRNTIRWIQNHSPALASMALNGEIAIVGAMYDVSTGKVEFLDGVGFNTKTSP